MTEYSKELIEETIKCFKEESDLIIDEKPLQNILNHLPVYI